ncbi:MAG: hypothetical protein F4Y46_03395, partial [Chloroflexi bacterium]|nr:hypothetical protein [Chloroflexota bacterium]
MNRSDQDLARQLAKVTPATATHLLEQKGISNTYMAGLQAVVPVSGVVVGRARTLRQIPMREAGHQAMVAAGSSPHRLVSDHIAEGDFLVIDSGGEVTAGSIGDIISARIKAQGGVGVISDGGLRDGVQIRELVGLPCFVKGIHGAASQRSFMAIDYDQPVRCCGTSVFPGDWILADGDGAVVIPPSLAAEIAAEGSAIEHKETFIRERVLEHGYPLSEAYPPNEKT